MRKTILFVDDQESILMSLRYVANTFFKDYRAFFAKDGLEALEIMDEEEIDVVVSDLTMPNMDGTKLLQIIAERSPKTFRIIHSATFDGAEIYKASQYCHEFLEKPCDLDVLKKVIEQAVFASEVLVER